MRCRWCVFSHDIKHGLQSAIAGGTTCAEGTREKFGVELAQLLTRNRHFFPTFFGAGREEFKA